MKALLMIATALLALACSGTQPEDTGNIQYIDFPGAENYPIDHGLASFDNGSSDGDIGTLSQPLYALDGWGADGNGLACWSPNGWAGGYCSVPNGFTWKIIFPDANHTQGCSADQRVGLTDAATDFRSYMQSLGSWNITLQSMSEACPGCAVGNQNCAGVGACNPGGAKTVLLSCLGTPPDSHTLGAVRVPTSIGCTTSISCKKLANGSLGNFQSYNAPLESTKIFHGNFENQSYYVNANSFQRRRFVRNLAFHELFHVPGGLGHEPTSDLMWVVSSANVNHFLNDLVYPNTFEANLLDCVNPDRDGLFDRCGTAP